MTEFEIKALEALDAIQTLLKALVGDCEATKVLEKRRAKDAERKQKKRAAVRGQTIGEKTKDEERDIPPTPPIEKEAEKRKARDTNARARAKGSKRFQKPTIEEIADYCAQRNNGIDPEEFFVFYESKGWCVGKSPMKKWKSAVITWEKKRRKDQKYAASRYERKTENQNCIVDYSDRPI